MYEDRGLRVFSLEERYVAVGGANFRLESPQRVTSADLTWQAMELGTKSRGGSPGCRIHA